MKFFKQRFHIAVKTKYGINCLNLMMNGDIDISLIQLLVDAMLFVLIWIVQVVVYPGFCYYKDSDLRKWHKTYSLRITTIVMPLMLGQLILYSYSSYMSPSTTHLVMMVLVILVWMITFLIAVPLHQKIDSGVMVKEASRRLVKTNWTRTTIWTIIFIISIATYGK